LSRADFGGSFGNQHTNDFGFTTTYAISAYHHWCCEFESRSRKGVHYVIKLSVTCWLATGRWFSPGPPVSSTNILTAMI